MDETPKRASSVIYEYLRKTAYVFNNLSEMEKHFNAIRYAYRIPVCINEKKKTFKRNFYFNVPLADAYRRKFTLASLPKQITRLT